MHFDSTDSNETHIFTLNVKRKQMIKKNSKCNKIFLLKYFYLISLRDILEIDMWCYTKEKYVQKAKIERKDSIMK